MKNISLDLVMGIICILMICSIIGIFFLPLAFDYWQDMRSPTMSEKLKPCPFCGEVPIIHRKETTFSTTGEVYFIECNCGQAKAIGRTKERFLERWESRQSPPPFETPEELKRVIEKIDQFNKKYNWISVEGCSDEDWLDFIIAYKQMELVFDNLVYIANHHGKFPKDYRP